MSAFESTFLDIALRDCGINAFMIVGVATEIGIEPTVRHGADRGYLPVVVTDACGAGDDEAGARSLIAYTYLPHKPSLGLKTKDLEQLPPAMF